MAASTVTGPKGRRPAARRYSTSTAAETPNGAALGRYTRAGVHDDAVASTSTQTVTAPILATTKFQSIEPLAARKPSATTSTTITQPARGIGLCECAQRGTMPPSASTRPSRSRACPCRTPRAASTRPRTAPKAITTNCDQRSRWDTAGRMTTEAASPTSPATVTTAPNASHCEGFDVRSPSARTTTNTAKSVAKSSACAVTLSTAPSRSNDRVAARPVAANSDIDAMAAKRTTTASRASGSVVRIASAHVAWVRSMTANQRTGTSAAAAIASAHRPGSRLVSGDATRAPTPAMMAIHTSSPPLTRARRAANSGHSARAVSGAAASASRPCQRAKPTSAGTRPGNRNCS